MHLHRKFRVNEYGFLSESDDKEPIAGYDLSAGYVAKEHHHIKVMI